VDIRVNLGYKSHKSVHANFWGCTSQNAMLSCLGGLQDATGVGGCSEAQLVTL